MLVFKFIGCFSSLLLASSNKQGRPHGTMRRQGIIRADGSLSVMSGNALDQAKKGACAGALATKDASVSASVEFSDTYIGPLHIRCGNGEVLTLIRTARQTSNPNRLWRLECVQIHDINLVDCKWDDDSSGYTHTGQWTLGVPGRLIAGILKRRQNHTLYTCQLQGADLVNWTSQCDRSLSSIDTQDVEYKVPGDEFLYSMTFNRNTFGREHLFSFGTTQLCILNQTSAPIPTLLPTSSPSPHPSPAPTSDSTHMPTSLHGVAHVIHGTGKCWFLGSRDECNNTGSREIMTGIQDVAAGFQFIVLLGTNRTVYGLGDWPGSLLSQPTKVFNDTVRISASWYNVLYVTSNGSVFRLGNDYKTDGVFSTPQKILTGYNITEIAACSWCSLFLGRNGSVFGLGHKTGPFDPDEPTLLLPDGLDAHAKFKAMACSKDTIYLLTEQGILYMKQQNYSRIMIDVKAVSSGPSQALVLTNEGTAYVHIPNAPMLQVMTGVQTISAGTTHHWFIMENQTLFKLEHPHFNTTSLDMEVEVPFSMVGTPTAVMAGVTKISSSYGVTGWGYADFSVFVA